MCSCHLHGLGPEPSQQSVIISNKLYWSPQGLIAIEDCNRAMEGNEDWWSWSSYFTICFSIPNLITYIVHAHVLHGGQQLGVSRTGREQWKRLWNGSWNLWRTFFHAVHVAVYLLINLLIVSSAVESAFAAREGMQAVVLGKLCNTEDAWEGSFTHAILIITVCCFQILHCDLVCILYHTPVIPYTLSSCSPIIIPSYIMSYSNHHSSFDSDTYFWSQ